jgi:hypothetical protein
VAPYVLALALALGWPGEQCAADDDCREGLVCWPRPAGDGAWCVVGCRPQHPRCPEGTICAPLPARPELPQDACHTVAGRRWL